MVVVIVLSGAYFAPLALALEVSDDVSPRSGTPILLPQFLVDLGRKSILISSKPLIVVIMRFEPDPKVQAGSADDAHKRLERGRSTSCLVSRDRGLRGLGPAGQSALRQAGLFTSELDQVSGPRTHAGMIPDPISA